MCYFSKTMVWLAFPGLQIGSGMNPSAEKVLWPVPIWSKISSTCSLGHTSILGGWAHPSYYNPSSPIITDSCATRHLPWPSPKQRSCYKNKPAESSGHYDIILSHRNAPRNERGLIFFHHSHTAQQHGKSKVYFFMSMSHFQGEDQRNHKNLVVKSTRECNAFELSSY